MTKYINHAGKAIPIPPMIHAEIKLTLPQEVIKDLILNYVKETFPPIPGYNPTEVFITVKDQKASIGYSGSTITVEYSKSHEPDQ